MFREEIKILSYISPTVVVWQMPKLNELVKGIGVELPTSR